MRMKLVYSTTHLDQETTRHTLQFSNWTHYITERWTGWWGKSFRLVSEKHPTCSLCAAWCYLSCERHVLSSHCVKRVVLKQTHRVWWRFLSQRQIAFVRLKKERETESYQRGKKEKAPMMDDISADMNMFPKRFLEAKNCCFMSSSFLKYILYHCMFSRRKSNSNAQTVQSNSSMCVFVLMVAGEESNQGDQYLVVDSN